jgi:DNA-binding transcriptional regulator YhcF (GntR family)
LYYEGKLTTKDQLPSERPFAEDIRKTGNHFVSKEQDQMKSELHELSIKYKESAITDMKQLIQSHNTILIFAPGSSTSLTAAKIHQMLSATTQVILNLQQLIRFKFEVMLAWRSEFDVLVLDS